MFEKALESHNNIRGVLKEVNESINLTNFETKNTKKVIKKEEEHLELLELRAAVLNNINRLIEKVQEEMIKDFSISLKSGDGTQIRTIIDVYLNTEYEICCKQQEHKFYIARKTCTILKSIYEEHGIKYNFSVCSDKKDWRGINQSINVPVSLIEDKKINTLVTKARILKRED